MGCFCFGAFYCRTSFCPTSLSSNPAALTTVRLLVLLSGLCSQEDTHLWKTDAALRRARSLRRTRSAPGGLMELDNSAHILSIGYVHRHRPFNAEYDVGEAVGTGGFAVGTGWRQIRVCPQPRGGLKSNLTFRKQAKARRVCERNEYFGFHFCSL